jgi:tetratricopeptide (TPR) repeat protein
LDRLRSLLMERTEGYPFYIEETVQGFVEEGVLEGECGAYRLTAAVQRITMPATVQSVIGARIDRLSAGAKRLPQTASVIGKDFELSLLRHVTEFEDGAVQQYLATLQGSEFVYEIRLFPDPEYTFKHALTHQVARESLLGDRRREKRAEILRAMERLFQDSLEKKLERIVFHAVRGENWDAVHTYGMAADHQALAISASHSAVTAFDYVLQALQKLPETPERLRDAIDTRLALREALFVLGSSSRDQALMDEAYAMAGQLGDERRLVEALLYQSGNEWSFGRLVAAATLAREALALARKTGDEQLIGLANYRITTATVIRGEHFEASEVALAGFEVLRSVASTYMRFGGLVQTFLGSFGAIALAELGRFEEAEKIGREAYETAMPANHAYSISVSSFGLAHSLLLRGAVDEAIGPLDEGLRQADVHKIGAAVSWLAGRAAYAPVAADQHDDVGGTLTRIAVNPRAFSRAL